MRCDANVSLRPRGSEKFGTRAEIKNLNSFKNVKDALEYEYKRQAEILDGGGRVIQETRLWNANKAATFSMRSKEEAHDYRYFPDPDLVPLKADPAWVSRLRAGLPELPAVKRARFVKEYALSDYDADVLASERPLASFFEQAAKIAGASGAKPLANLMMTELLGKLNAEKKNLDDCPITPKMMAELVGLLQSGKISSKAAKDVFAGMWKSGKAPVILIDELGLTQVSDENQVREWVKEALAANPQAAEDLRGGKDRAIGSVVGAVMKLSKGKANPAMVNKLIKEAVK